MNAQRPRGLLKSTPACFVVQELIGANVTPIPLHTKTQVAGRHREESYTVFDMVKKSVTTPYAVQQVARQLGVPAGNITYHGLKDRHAHTAQRIAVRGDFHPRFWHNNIILHEVGGSREPLKRGGNAGNRFQIDVLSNATHLDKAAVTCVRNFFGSQRFGTRNGPKIGRFLLEGNFEAAAGLVSDVHFHGSLNTLKERLGSWSKAFFDPWLSFDCSMSILQWQSWLWNKRLTGFEDSMPDQLPMWQPGEQKWYQHLWDPKSLDTRALALLHRFRRPTLVRPKNISMELRHGYWHICFDLPSGAYATIVLSELFHLFEPDRSISSA